MMLLDNIGYDKDTIIYVGKNTFSICESGYIMVLPLDLKLVHIEFDKRQVQIHDKGQNLTWYVDNDNQELLQQLLEGLDNSNNKTQTIT